MATRFRVFYIHVYVYIRVLYIHVVEMRLYSKLPPYRADPKSSYNLS